MQLQDFKRGDQLLIQTFRFPAPSAVLPMAEQERSGLAQAAGTARAVHGAIKTGKAISSAAKGAAAGVALAAGQHGKKLLAAAAVVLMLPVLFVLMLPGLIFGGLTSSGMAGQPIVLNEASKRSRAGRSGLLGEFGQSERHSIAGVSL